MSRDAEPKLPTVEGYQVLHLIGEGAMGRVYEARQEPPLERSVALKLLKPLVAAGPSGRRRFGQEQSALARLDHPSIARVYAQGTTEAGEPYVAIELVQGSSVTEFCDRRQLSIPSRIRLLIQILDGIEHAHERGVLHRDLKPSNVLVDEASDPPRPKVVDFGIALVDRDDDEAARLTRTGEVVGTLAFMAPELLNGRDASETTDVYSLGVLAYELLIGELPFPSSAYRYPAVLGLAAKTPPRLRRRLSTIASTQEMLARARGTDVRTLRLQLCGPLERIIAKAVEPYPDERTPSVSAFKRDLVAHLDGRAAASRTYDPLSGLRRFSRGWSRLQMEATTRVMSQTTMGFAVLAMLLVPAIGPLDVSGSPLVSWATVGGFLGAQAMANWLGHRIDIRRGRERDLPFLIGMAFMNAVVVVAVVSGLLRG